MNMSVGGKVHQLTASRKECEMQHEPLRKGKAIPVQALNVAGG